MVPDNHYNRAVMDKTTKNLLKFLDSASITLKQAMIKRPRANRKVNHRKYLHRQVNKHRKIAGENGFSKLLQRERCLSVPKICESQSSLKTENRSLIVNEKLEKITLEAMFGIRILQKRCGKNHIVPSEGCEQNKLSKIPMRMRKFPNSFFNEPSKYFSSNTPLSISSLSCQSYEASKNSPSIQKCEFESFYPYLFHKENNYENTNNITIFDFDQIPLADLNYDDLETNSLTKKDIEPVSVDNGNPDIYELNIPMEDLLSSPSWKEIMSNQDVTKTERKDVFHFNHASSEKSSDHNFSQLQDVTTIWSESNKNQCVSLNSRATDLASYSQILPSPTSHIQDRQETKSVAHNSDHSSEELFFEIFENRKLSNNLWNTSNTSVVNEKYFHPLEDQTLSENLLMDLSFPEHTLLTNNSVCYSTRKSDSTMNSLSMFTYKAHSTNDLIIDSNCQDIHQAHISPFLLYPEDNSGQSQEWKCLVKPGKTVHCQANRQRAFDCSDDYAKFLNTSEHFTCGLEKHYTPIYDLPRDDYEVYKPDI